MNNEDEDTITINAPRSNCVWFLQLLSASPLVTMLFYLWNYYNTNDSGFLMLSAILLFIAFLLIYIPQTYVTRIVFDRNKRDLTKLSKGKHPITFDLDGAQQIITTREYTSPGWKYTMALLAKDGETHIIFNEDVVGGKHWAAFTEKISKITRVSLKEELWAQDFNGKRHLITKEKVARGKMQNYTIALVPFIITFTGAILFRMQPTSENLLIAGIASVAINLGLSFTYLFKHRDNFSHFGKSKFLLGVYVLAFSIPYFFFYFTFAFVLNGFRIPFGN